MANWLIGVDTGGTFTDLIAFDTVKWCTAAGQSAVCAKRSVARRDRCAAKTLRRRRAADRRRDARARHDGRHECSARRQGSARRPAHHERLPRGLRGAWLVAAARCRPARYLLPEAAAARAAVSHRGGYRTTRLRRASVVPLDEDGVAHVGTQARAQGRGCDRRLLSVFVRQPGAREACRRNRCAGGAGLPHFGLSRGAARHPRISTVIDDGGRCLRRSARRQLSWQPRNASRYARCHYATEIPDAVKRWVDAAFAWRAPSQPDVAVRPRSRRYRRRRARA